MHELLIVQVQQRFVKADEQGYRGAGDEDIAFGEGEVTVIGSVPSEGVVAGVEHAGEGDFVDLTDFVGVGFNTEGWLDDADDGADFVARLGVVVAEAAENFDTGAGEVDLFPGFAQCSVDGAVVS